MSAVVAAAALFAIGLYGVLTRRDVIGLLASVEVMLGGALVMLVALGASAEQASRVEGIALMLLVIAAAEAAVGLALLVAIARRSRTTRVDDMMEVRG